MTANDSIVRTSTVWQSENDVVIPVEVHEAVPAEKAERVSVIRQTAVKAPAHARYGVPRLLSWPYAGKDDIAANDTVTIQDTIAVQAIVAGEQIKGIVLVNPASQYVKEAEGKPVIPEVWKWGGMSWVYLAITVMFCAICLKFKGNSRYMKAIFNDLTDTRLRNNVFDETVRETSLVILMNVMWTFNAGVLLWNAVKLFSGVYVQASEVLMDPRSFTINCPEWIGIGVCTGVCGAYLVVMTIAYWLVGNIFSDRHKTRLWVKGSAASTSLETMLLFPLSLLALVYPEWMSAILWTGAGVFVTGKLVFLYKGFRIFFAEISSWMLFLYYLCSLEIVPLILTYFGAVAACGSLH